MNNEWKINSEAMVVSTRSNKYNTAIKLPHLSYTIKQSLMRNFQIIIQSTSSYILNESPNSLQYYQRLLMLHINAVDNKIRNPLTFLPLPIYEVKNVSSYIIS